MSRRKGWDQLSEKYRNRLVRNGISQRDYEQGVSLASARGHTSPLRENYRRRVRRFAKDYHTFYDLSESEIKQTFYAMPVNKGTQVMREQREMQRLYDRGDVDLARQRWERRDTSLPEWMYYYHGVFAF